MCPVSTVGRWIEPIRSNRVPLTTDNQRGEGGRRFLILEPHSHDRRAQHRRRECAPWLGTSCLSLTGDLATFEE